MLDVATAKDKQDTQSNEKKKLAEIPMMHHYRIFISWKDWPNKNGHYQFASKLEELYNRALQVDLTNPRTQKTNNLTFVFGNLSSHDGMEKNNKLAFM